MMNKQQLAAGDQPANLVNQHLQHPVTSNASSSQMMAASEASSGQQHHQMLIDRSSGIGIEASDLVQEEAGSPRAQQPLNSTSAQASMHQQMRAIGKRNTIGVATAGASNRSLLTHHVVHAAGPPNQHRNHSQLQQINKVMHHEEVSRQTLTDECNNTGSSNRTEDDFSASPYQRETEDRRKEEMEEDVLDESLNQEKIVMNPFMPPQMTPSQVAANVGSGEARVVGGPGRQSKAQPPAQMKQMQGPAKYAVAGSNRPGQVTRLSMALGSASSLIELQALTHHNQAAGIGGNTQLQKHRYTQSISGSKAVGQTSINSQSLQMSSPTKKMRQKSQASIGNQQSLRPSVASSGLKSNSSNQVNYSSMPSITFEQNNFMNNNQKLRKNSPPVQQPMSKSQTKKGPGQRDTSCASGAKEPLGSVSLPPRNNISTLVQKTTVRKKPNASLNSRKSKKPRSLLREQGSPEKITLLAEYKRKSEASQDGKQSATNNKSADEEINYFADSLHRRSISGSKSLVAQVRRASEKQSQDIEEEKDVPSEHPTNHRKITPTRNGCNVTTQKGFSFDKNMIGLNQQPQKQSMVAMSAPPTIYHTQILETDQDQVQSSAEATQEVIEAGFVVIDQESRALLTDIEEMESGQDTIQKSAYDISKQPSHLKHLIHKQQQHVRVMPVN